MSLTTGEESTQVLERLLTAAAKSGAVVIVNIDHINVYGGSGISLNTQPTEDE